MLIANGGLDPLEIRGPWKRWCKSWGRKLGVEFPVDSAYALYSCFQHVWYTFTRGSDEVVWGHRVTKYFQARYRSPLATLKV